MDIKGISGHNGYNNIITLTGNGKNRCVPQAIFSMFNGLHIQFWCFSLSMTVTRMFKQPENISVATRNTTSLRYETDEYMIENCHNGLGRLRVGGPHRRDPFLSDRRFFFCELS